MRLPFIAAPLLLTTVLPIQFAVAQDQGEADSLQTPVIVTGTRLALLAARQGGDVTVVDRAAIEDSSATGALDLLKTSAGLDVVQEGAAGGASFVSIRGGDENFTQVLIDGVKVNDPTDTAGGAFDFNLIDPIQIERIEISRKVGSSIYGADSLSGIIQIQTRRSSDALEQAMRFSIDTENAYDAAYFITGPINDAAFSAGLSVRDGGDQVGGDRYQRYSANTGFDASLGNRNTLSASLLYAEGETERFPETSGGPRLAELRETESLDSTFLTVSANLKSEVSETTTLNNLLTYMRSELDTDSPGILAGGQSAVPALTSDSQFERYELTSNLLFQDLSFADFGPEFDLTLGGAFLLEDGTSEGVVDFGILIPNDFELERETVSIFAELATDMTDQLTAIISTRHDSPDGFDAETTYGALLLYRLPETDTVFDLSWGKGFKLPSFFALGSSLIGNPDLLPEESENLSASVQQGFGEKVQLRLSLFQNEYTNLIEFDPNLFTNVNLSSVEVTGLELSGELQPTDTVTLGGQLTLSETEVNGAEADLRFRPDTRASIFVDWAASDHLKAGLTSRYVGERIDNAIPIGDLFLEDYIRHDAYLTFSFDQGFDLRLDAINLADESYEEVIGYPARGRSLKITLKSDF